MRTLLLKQTRRGLALALSLLLLATVAGAAPVIAQTATSGIVCTTGASLNPIFTLTAKSGYIRMPDGNSVFMWSYAPGNGVFQEPGPVLCVNQGDTVTVVLNNTLPEATSIIFPGIDNVQVNGAPAQPQFDGTGALTSLTNVATAINGSVTYSFVATDPGTYLYESGTDPGKQVQMGLYGALVVRPTGVTPPAGAACAYDFCSSAPYTSGNTTSVFNPATEFVMLFSEVDPTLHQAVERSVPYDVTTLHPRYWLINGRSFPDTIAPNNAAYLPSQPYSALVHMTVNDYGPSAVNPLPALIRYLNAGQFNHPFHPHGQNGRILARDARPLLSPTGADLTYETFAFTIGSGQTWDATYAFYDQEGWNPTTNPLPVTIPQLQNLGFKDNATWFSGSPYLGYQDDLPVGVTSYNQCGEFYFVFHSHALYEVANFDTSFGGMLTLQRIDPPVALQNQTGLLCQ